MSKELELLEMISTGTAFSDEGLLHHHWIQEVNKLVEARQKIEQQAPAKTLHQILKEVARKYGYNFEVLEYQHFVNSREMEHFYKEAAELYAKQSRTSEESNKSEIKDNCAKCGSFEVEPLPSLFPKGVYDYQCLKCGARGHNDGSCNGIIKKTQPKTVSDEEINRNIKEIINNNWEEYFGLNQDSFIEELSKWVKEKLTGKQ